MRALWFVAALALLPACGQSLSPASPIVQVSFSYPGPTPPQWTLTLHPGGAGHFRSRMGNCCSGSANHPLPSPIDRDLQLRAPDAAPVFLAAGRQPCFDRDGASRLKVAFQRWKTISYRRPRGHGSCTFNFSLDKEIRAIEDSFQTLAPAVVEGARMEVHHPLGLDAEMEFFVRAANDGRARQIAIIGGIPKGLA